MYVDEIVIQVPCSGANLGSTSAPESVKEADEIERMREWSGCGSYIHDMDLG